jgi:hypothetical protein
MAEKLVVPRLRVRRDWHKGLAADPINREPRDGAAHRDAQDGTLAADALGSEFAGAAQRGRRRMLAAGAGAADGHPAAASRARRRLLQAPPCPAHLGRSTAAAAALAAGCSCCRLFICASACGVRVCGGLRMCLSSRQSAWQGSRLCGKQGGATRMRGHRGAAAVCHCEASLRGACQACLPRGAARAPSRCVAGCARMRATRARCGAGCGRRRRGERQRAGRAQGRRRWRRPGGRAAERARRPRIGPRGGRGDGHVAAEARWPR